MTPIFWNAIYENRLKNPYILIQKYEKIQNFGFMSARSSIQDTNEDSYLKKKLCIDLVL